MTCDAHLFDGALECQRTDAHLTGHIFVSTGGSDVNDRHEDGGHG